MERGLGYWLTDLAQIVSLVPGVVDTVTSEPTYWHYKRGSGLTPDKPIPFYKTTAGVVIIVGTIAALGITAAVIASKK